MITCIRARKKQLMPWNLPNTLTWARIAAIPLIVVLFYMPYPWADPAAGLLFAAAGVTDSLDGYFARRLGQVSRLGAFLDPVAVSQLGKYKTILQIIGLSLMLYRWHLFGLPTYRLGVGLTEIAAAATLVSMAAYLRIAWPELKR